MAEVTERRLNRATLDRQLLLRRERVDVVEATRRIGAIQAQEPASPYLALWNRIDGFDPTWLDDAFATGAVLKGSLMRLTLHAVAATDHPPFRAATLPLLRAAGLNDRRFRDTGLSPERADELIEELAAAGVDEPVTRERLEPLLEAALGEPPAPGLWRAVRFVAPFSHAVTGGPWSFGRTPAFSTLPTSPAAAVGEGLRHLVRRYLTAFGPATVADICQFTLQPRPPVRAAVSELGDELIRLAGDEGVELLDVEGLAVPDADVPAPPRLLPMWDSTLFAYADRRRIIPEAHRSVVIRRNGDSLATVLVDGQVRGVWRAVETGIEVTPLMSIDDDTWDGIEAEAEALRSFLADREPLVYPRFDRWWAQLPDEGRRILG
ncbi:MAG: winged helix DNA-binding domain-containing protein [Actinomycetota bacterium]